MALWGRGESTLEEGDSYEVWGRWGDELLSWEAVFMVVVCGETFVWVGRILVNILGLRLGWGIE